MILIAHRGNLSGKNPEYENHPDYIAFAIDMGFHAEVDVWHINGSFFTGHDYPQYETTIDFLKTPNLWIHCKNIKAMEILSPMGLNAFAHEDGIIITPNGYLWTAPGLLLTKRSIAVMPEMADNWDMSEFCGICTDLITDYGHLLSDNNV
jgi:hypothetical protein